MDNPQAIKFMEEETKKVTEPTTSRKARRKSTVKKAKVSKKTKELLHTGREKIGQIPFHSIWDQLKKEVKVTVEAIGKGTEKAAGKTVIMSKQARIQYEVYSNQLKLRNSFAELGGRIYDLLKTSSPALILQDPQASPIIEKIAEFDEKILKLKENAKVLKNS